MNNKELYIYFDKPIPYKRFGGSVEDKGLKLYPVRMDRYFEFYTTSSVLLIDKNSIPDVSVISMTYLQFLFSKANDENRYFQLLGMLLRMVLTKDDEEEIELKFLSDGDKNCVISVNGEMYDSNDFDEIREIVIAQNLLDAPDENIEKSLRDAMAEVSKIRQKMSGNGKPTTLEDQIVGLSVMSGISLDDIYKMTIRKFIKSIERIDHALHYKIFLAAQESGFVKYKQKPKHWLANLERDELDGVISYDEMEQKLSATSGK